MLAVRRADESPYNGNSVCRAGNNMDCDECIRREHRLNVAKLYVEFAKKKFEQNPQEAKFPLEQAEAYLDTT